MFKQKCGKNTLSNRKKTIPSAAGRVKNVQESNSVELVCAYDTLFISFYSTDEEQKRDSIRTRIPFRAQVDSLQ